MARQRPDGSFRDYVADVSATRRDAYGPALLGTGLLLHGLRTRRDAAISSGLRAIAFALGRGRVSSPFEALALAVGYRAAQAQLRSDPRRLALDERWRARLFGFNAHPPAGRPSARRDDYTNLQLVETVAALEGRAAGLASSRPEALLHPGGIAATTARILERTLPALAARQQRPSRDGLTAVISDPPNNPIAYHALSIGLLARALDAAGGTAPATTRATLVQGARASWAFMSPPGDVAWSGRGQSQSWTLAMTALGAITASRQPGVDYVTRARLYSTARRALARLRDPFLDAGTGVWITPAFAQHPIAAIRGLDFYAASASYTGLTLVALEWVAADPGMRQPPTLLDIAADRNGHAVVARSGTFTSIRRGNVWMSIKERPAVPVHEKADHTHDLRYDAGVTAALITTAAGRWEPVLRPLPITAKWDTAGPALTVRGRRGRMVGYRTDVKADGSAEVTARFMTHGGAMLRRARVTFSPIPCGVRTSVAGRAHETWDLTTFFATRPHQISDRAVTDGHVVLSANRHAAITVDGRYASGTDPRLVRARLRVRLERRALVVFDACRR